MKNNLVRIFGALASVSLCCFITADAASQKADAPKKILVVTVTKGFRHSSIPTAEKTLKELAQRTGIFTVDVAGVDPGSAEFKGPDGKSDANKVHQAIVKLLAEKMSPAALANYDAVIFANTTGDLPLPDKQGFLDWIKSGKAFIGMHSATDTFGGHKPPDAYVEMIGGEFKTHHAQVGVECLVQDPKHPATRHLGQSFKVKQEEIYLIKNYSPAKVHELLVLDKHPNDKTPGHFPIAWCKEYGKGKVFYTSLGHREDIWDTDPDLKGRINPVEVSGAYQKHILGGIEWALGLKKGDATPQAK